MNHRKVYFNIISKAQNRVLLGYGEVHHIVPRCMGGSNEKSNLVKLTAREHVLCHILLAKIHGGKLWAAVNRMTNNGELRSKAYEIFRKNYAKSITGKGNPRYGLAVKQNTRTKIGNGNRGKIRTPETRANISKAGRFKTRSEISKIKYSRAKGGMRFKAYKLIGDTFRKSNIAHLERVFVGSFNSSRECSKVLQIPHQSIGYVLRQQKSHVLGYVFEVDSGCI